MPYSSDEGKAWALRRLAELKPSTIVDIGAGAGAYARMLRPRLHHAHLTAIEVHEPYVQRFGLCELYDLVIVSDVRTWPLPTCDAVILGDVLEHFTKPEAVAVWEKARKAAGHVLLSLPIVEYPQGPSEDNPHEAHLHTWSHDQVLELGGIIDYSLGDEIGVYLAEGLR